MDYFREIFDVMQDQIKIEKRLNRLSEKTELIERYARQDTIEINGMPENRREYLKHIVILMSSFLSCPLLEQDIVATRRIRCKHPRPIIVKFRNRRIRDRLIAAGVNYNLDNDEPLNTHHLGFDGLKNRILLATYPSRVNKVHRTFARRAAQPPAMRVVPAVKEETKAMVKQQLVPSLQSLALRMVNILENNLHDLDIDME